MPPSTQTIKPGTLQARLAYKAPPLTSRSEVDLSLFGPSKSGAKARAAAAPQAAAAAAAAGQAAAPLCLAASEVTALRRGALLGDGEARRAAAEAASLAAERHALAEERKERIRGMEAHRLANVPKSQLEQEEEEEKRARRALALALQEERTDAMKSMNSMLNSAITVSIRDRQVAERAAQRAAAATEARLLDLRAEVEAMEAQQRSDAAAASAREHTKVQQRALAEQLAAALSRKRAALEAAQAEDRERKAGMAAALAAETAGKAADKARRAAQLQDFKAHNDAAVAARAGARAAELAAERRADEEAAALAQKREAQLAAAEAARAEKERVLALTAGAVTRLVDDRDAKEELRARRALEAAARREREAELGRARARAAAEADLAASRAAMAQAKAALAAGLIEEEREEYLRAASAQEEWLARDRAAGAARAAANAQLLADLSAQVEAKKEAVRARRAGEAAEEAARAAAAAEQVAFLKGIRDRKVAEVQALGVDARWTTQLAGYNSERIAEKLEMSGRPPIVKAEGVVGPGWKK
jgi:hypothetical protein